MTNEVSDAVSSGFSRSRCCLGWLGSAMLWLSAPTAIALPIPSNNQPTTPNNRPPSGICPAQLSARIDAIINQPDFARARWGILIQAIDRAPQTLYDRDSTRFFLPASNAKLFTTAAALTKLGGDYRIRTAIVGAPSDRAKGVWNLRLIGKGDPSFGEAQLKNLVQQMKRQGVQQINQLTLDDRGFAGEAVNPAWEWGDLQESYGSIVNSLILNQNALSVTITPQQLGQPLRLQFNQPQAIAGWTIVNQTKTVAPTEPEFTSITRDISQPILRVSGQFRVGASADTVEFAAPDPVLVWRDRIALALREAQIPLQQVTVLSLGLAPGLSPGLGGDNPADRELAFVESPPLRELIRETNQASNNLYAEALLKQLGTGLAISPQPSPAQLGESATDAGLTTLQNSLKAIQVNPTGYQLVDGSGLARLNLASPAAIVQVLQGMASSPLAQDYRRSLSVAGRSGTLSTRFRNTAAQDILVGKTGTITNVAALSGYIAPPQYQPLAFSILLNQSTLSAPAQRQAIDQIVFLLAQLRRCSP
jgi:serine-type D-Ala-D-Ala carboxypeptidase/endopeptidase (penicillin-binding protein 4)